MPQSRVGDVIFEAHGRVGRLVIDRPTVLNALSPSVVAGLGAAVDAATEAGCRVVVVRGAGGNLSVGADLTYLREVLDDRRALRSYITSIGDTLGRLSAASFVSVCAVEGYALAGGCELMLACDLIVATDDARIGDRHLEYGLLPGAGGSVRLTQALPPAVARRLLYTGEIIDGRTAAGLGLVGYAVPPDRLDTEVDRLAARLGRHPAEALAAMKRLHTNARTADPAQAITAERETLLRYLEGAPAREGLAAFAEGREPDFDGIGPAEPVRRTSG